jgi:hypothetical protein
MESLLPYHANSLPVRFCPVATSTQLVATASADTQGSAASAWIWFHSPQAFGSYGYNGWLYSGANVYGSAGQFFGKESAVTKPSQTPVFVDSVWVDAWPLVTDKPGTPCNLYTGGDIYSSIGMPRFLIARHGKGSANSAPRNISAAFTTMLPGSVDVACYDSHVELVPLDGLWSKVYWHVGYVPANRPRP